MATAPLARCLLDSPSGPVSGPRPGLGGLGAHDLAVIEEVQWLVENATGTLLPATDPAVLSVASVAAGLRGAQVPHATFLEVVAREARLQRLAVVPEVLAHRLWAVTAEATAA